MDLVAVAKELIEEARSCNERRLLVLTGERDEAYDSIRAILVGIDVPPGSTTLVSEHSFLQCEQIEPTRSTSIMGSTRDVIVLDLHDATIPNTIGRVCGAVSGGGLLLLVCPPLDDWPSRRDDFDEGMAVPPFELADVEGHFRRRLVKILLGHPGIGIVNVRTGAIEQSGLTSPMPRIDDAAPPLPDGHAFPRLAYDMCLTADQCAVVQAMEELLRDDRVVIVESDRGRGKSSAAGIAAGCMAANGEAVLVTAPGFRNARELFIRARDLCESMNVIEPVADDSDRQREPLDAAVPATIRTRTGGQIQFANPTTAVTRATENPPDVLFVDEAAGLSIRLLEQLLRVNRMAFTTTIHGYEGAGRGFSVRFRDRIDESHHDVTSIRMEEPIRYAAGDPIEAWCNRALLLDAGPPVEQLVTDADAETVEYVKFPTVSLLADENRLRETIGLLVLAHYRTEPNDIARILDAPNLSIRALSHDGRVVCVVLLAREGGLSGKTRKSVIEGNRIRGNMIPDVLMSQLRDENAGTAAGIRIVRIATHHAVRSRGLGSRLLSDVRTEFESEVDWFGTGYGATPDLLSFWDRNGFSTVYLSIRRNDSSGEFSVIMLAPTNEVGAVLHDQHARFSIKRVLSTLPDAHRCVDPDVIRTSIRTTRTTFEPSFDVIEWQFVTDMAYGPGHFDVYPAPFRKLAIRHLLDRSDPAELTVRQERLLVRKVLQGHPWDSIMEGLDFVSTRECRIALGTVYRTLVDHYGDDIMNALRKPPADDT